MSVPAVSKRGANADDGPVSVNLDLQIALVADGIPSAAFFTDCAARALSGRRSVAELTIRIVGLAEARALNLRWRDRDCPTNVLSFPLSGLEQIAPDLLGDIVLCAPIIATEAAAQGKPSVAHWAHMTVHGVLHLLGFTHEHATEATLMEACERAILADLGLPDPYAMSARK